MQLSVFPRSRYKSCLLDGLFDDPRVHVLTSAVTDTAIASLSEQEAAFVTNVVEKRRREFATARALAREGLARFYHVRWFDLLNREDRSPIWPAGISGSISHSDTRAWVAMVDAGLGSVGIDGESRNELKRNLWKFTLLEEEIAYLEELDPWVQARRALALFSAKEAIYKAQYPHSGCFMGYHMLHVEIGEEGSLRCIFQQEIGPFPSGFVVRGRWLDHNEIVTAAWIPTCRVGSALTLDRQFSD